MYISLSCIQSWCTRSDGFQSSLRVRVTWYEASLSMAQAPKWRLSSLQKQQPSRPAVSKRPSVESGQPVCTACFETRSALVPQVSLSMSLIFSFYLSFSLSLSIYLVYSQADLAGFACSVSLFLTLGSNRVVARRHLLLMLLLL